MVCRVASFYPPPFFQTSLGPWDNYFSIQAEVSIADSSKCIGAKYGGAGSASAPPALSDRSAGGARMCKVVLGPPVLFINTISGSNTVY